MVKVVDVFAGPGGLNEGFSRYENDAGDFVFKIAGSFEVDPVAIKTLKLRAAARALGVTDHTQYRSFINGRMTLDQFIAADDVRRELERVDDHVHELRLGPETRERSDELIRRCLSDDEPWVLVGGPPCQAYSLAGRSRMGHLEGFLDDPRHFLFKEYLHIIEAHRPTVFVMENVKGLLSATHGDIKMFDLIMNDLSCNGDYQVHSLVVDGAELEPRDFVIHAEKYGVPQKRHRVILLGVRRDAALSTPKTLTPQARQLTVHDVIGVDLPKLRSQLSPKRSDNVGNWLEARLIGTKHANPEGKDVWDAPPKYAGPTAYRGHRPGGFVAEWLRSRHLEVVQQHEPRSHMHSDLVRYAYLASKAEIGSHPTLKDLPKELLPNHKNVGLGNTPFADRFKVQAWSGPSSTIVSHISKDGHHFIHPDPWQARSLTVREAARLQTFPDDYFFMGNRTQQYHQVGNAVPPYLAHQIAHVVAELLAN